MYPKEADGGYDLRNDIIGTGPLQLKDHEPSVKFTLARNPDYWDKTAAMVDEIDLPIVPDYTTRLAQLQAGNIYYANSTNTLKAEDVLNLKKSEPRILLYQGQFSNGGAWVVTFGHLPAGQSKFQDERVRLAVSMSWDRDLYINTIIRQYDVQRRQIRSRRPSRGIKVELPPAVRRSIRSWRVVAGPTEFGVRRQLKVLQAQPCRRKEAAFCGRLSGRLRCGGALPQRRPVQPQ